MNAYIEQINLDTDSRNCEPDKAPILYANDGAETELPTRWEVCPVCNGNGTHVRPSIDCDGLTAGYMEEDREFAEHYRTGVFDIKCNKCNGRTTVRAVDWDRLDEKTAEAYRLQQADAAECAAECAAERAWGA